MYYRSWCNYFLQVQHGTGNLTGQPVISSSKSEYGRNNALWDTGFHVIGLSQGGPAALQLAHSQVMEYVHEAKWVGHLPGGMAPSGGGGVQCPGVLTWAAMVLFEKTHDLKFLAAVYAVFASNNAWWYKTYDTDGNGLCEWNGLISGWDNSPVSHFEHKQSCQHLISSGTSLMGYLCFQRWDTGPVDAVDLNAWLCLDQQTLAQMAALLGKPQTEVDGWWRQANHTAALMQNLLYDETSGLFLDWNAKTNKSVDVVTPATFFVLLPGVATHAQALRMARQLSNRSTLESPFPLPVVSRTDPTYVPYLYWRGPTWININFLTVVGLKRYGLHTEAERLRRSTLALVARGDVLREYYNSDNGTGLGAEK